jgi:hypothetical protein
MRFVPVLEQEEDGTDGLAVTEPGSPSMIRIAAVE